MNWKLAIVGCTLGLAAWVLAPTSALAVPVGNDYVCHQVKDLKTFGAFVPKTSVIVQDEAGVFTCEAKKPLLLCNPADVSGGGVGRLLPLSSSPHFSAGQG
jgi:hypothetical protein